jgi:hypothetical protein
VRDWESLRKRYLKDELPVRLGGLAANLARVCSFADRPAHGDVVRNVVEESKFFVEWSAPDAALDQQVDLVDLQLQLARWNRHWDAIWQDSEGRRALADQARVWSERVLKMSGLLG